MTLFSGRLKEERLRLRYGQGEFAELGGVNRRSQINYEKGERSPNASYLTAISEMGVDVIYVLTGVRLPQDVLDKLTAMMRLTREIEPNGGPLTDKAIQAIQAEGSQAVAENSPGYELNQNQLSASEQALLANYRASSDDAKQAMEITAKIMADKAIDAEKGS